MSDGYGMNVKGRNELLKKMQSKFGTSLFSAQVVAQATTPRTSKGKPDESRSDGENMMILNVQKKAGRNPVFIDSATDKESNNEWLRGIEAFLRGSSSAIDAAGKRVAEIIVSAIKGHILAGESSDGNMKPVSPRWDAIKKWKYGEHRPVLVASGQLMDSLVARFVRK